MERERLFLVTEEDSVLTRNCPPLAPCGLGGMTRSEGVKSVNVTFV